MSNTNEPHARTGCRLTLVESMLIILAVLFVAWVFSRAIIQAREAASRSLSKNNLKQLGLALHNYHDTSRTLPPGGVFNSQSVPYHCWSTSIDCYLEASPWYNQIDFSVPWDDPTQLDLFILPIVRPPWKNPRAMIPPRKDGLAETSYAANSWIMYRNSSVQLEDIADLQNTLLVAEARGHYLPLGCPGNWRDVSSGLNRSEDSFGLKHNEVTLVLMADGHVESFGPDTNPQVWQALAGSPKLRPADNLTQHPPFPYRLVNVPHRTQPRPYFPKE